MMTTPQIKAELPECICRSWCRSDVFWQVINGRRYPGPNHADGCPAQKREPFTVLEYDGARVTMEPGVADEMVREGAARGINYTQSTVHLTREQFERMDEFQGF